MSLSSLSSLSDHERPTVRRKNEEKLNAFEKYNDREFVSRFRISKETVLYLESVFGSSIKPLTKRNRAIQPVDQILIALRYYATGSYQRVIGDIFKVEQPTVHRIVHKVTAKIASLKSEFINMPTPEEFPAVANEFFALAGFPRVVGAVDCTHIKINSPGGAQSEVYRNRKGYFSLNVQMVCDARLRIRNVIARWPGSVHDSTIFNDSPLCAQLERGDFGTDEPCITKGFNGTCVGIFRCTSASLTYLYANAGFDVKKHELPELPDICSYKNNEPVVCCTDCNITQEEWYREYAIGPLGVPNKNDGSVASRKCYEYFGRLPYPCRGLGNFQVKKIWKEDLKCHQYNLAVALAVGGRDAQRWEFPHVALLGYGDDVESAQWLCGGSVISERFILTAGHCTSTRVLGNISFAALGLLKRTDPKEYWKIHKIKRIIIHPEYKPPSKYHDIALLETETEINFGRDLLPACLAADDTDSAAEASGWGRLGHKQTLADTLQVVYLNKYNDTECSTIYQPHRLLKNGYDNETQMCYGNHEEIIDTCEGDSGGPLQTNKFKCQYTIAGVTSYGKDCGILGSAGMYTRVAHYVPWIESVVWPEETEAKRKKDNLWLDKWLN